MSKFCMQCGAQIDDNAANCPSCGAAQNLSVNPQPANTEPNNDQKVNMAEPETASASIPQINIDQIKNMDPSKKKKIGIIAIAAAILLIILIVLRIIVSAGAYKKPFNNYEDAMNSGKGKYIYKSIPEYIMDSVFDDYKKSEIIEEFDDILDDQTEYYEDSYGKDYKYTIEFVDKDSITRKKLRSMEKAIKYTYGEKVDVTKGYEVTLKEKVKGKKGKTSSTGNTYTYNVYKIDGEWFCPDLYDGFVSSSYWDYDYSDALDDLEDIFD